MGQKPWGLRLACLRARGKTWLDLVFPPNGPGGIRTPDQAIMSRRADSPNPLQTQALTNPTESVLPVCLPDSAQNDPDPVLIVTSWKQLPAAVKTGIMAMVRAVEGR